MNDGQFSSMTRAMIDAAKADAPSAAARAKVWAGVSGAVGASGAAAAASGGASAAAAGGGAGAAGAAKMLAIGALLGGSVTVGLAVTMLRVGAAPPSAQERIAPAAAPILATQSPPSTPTLTASPTATAPPIPTLDVAAIPNSTRAPTPNPTFHPKPLIDPLAREAQLVSEARGALGRGDPARALQAIRAARALPSHQLEPEELAVEAHALRALGRTGDANGVDEKLRSKFPESALAR